VSELAEPCRECRAPLVPGQRYCLYCGARRPDARLEFLDVLAQDFARPEPAAAAAAALGPEPGVNGWLRANTPVLALAGIVLGTLLIGLLIGHWATGDGGGTSPAKAAAPQVIRVDAGGGGSAATTTSAADDTATANASDKKTSKAKKSSNAAAKPTAKAAAPPADAVSADALGSGAAKEKAIEKAAKKEQPISTGGSGELPPTDNKAPGGGSTFETIG